MRSIRVALVGLGVVMMGFGLVSALIGPHFNAYRHALFLVAVLALHDGVLLPFFLLIGYVVHRFVPARERAIVQGALIVTAAVTFVALPFMLAYGRTPDLPSALPRNYVGGYLMVMTLIWLSAAAAATIRRLRSPKPPHPHPQLPVDPGVSYRLDGVSGD